jgi:hypothetical protein
VIQKSILVLVGEDKLVSKDTDNGKSRDDHTEGTKKRWTIEYRCPYLIVSHFIRLLTIQKAFLQEVLQHG